MVYALGGGHGHAVRGSALTAALGQAGAQAQVLVPVEREHVALALGAPARPISRPADGPALARTVDRILAEQQAQWLVLDTFPEGLYGELDGLGTPVRRIALLRGRTDAAGPRLGRGMARVEHAFDLEPHLRWRPSSVAAEAFGPVVRPLRPSPAAADVLLVGTEAPLVGLMERLGARLARRGIQVARAGPDGLHGMGPTTPGFPLPPEVLGARVVVGPAGFNLTYEVRWLGGWHVALPRPRPYDDQALRARAVAMTVSSPGALERKVLQLLEAPPQVAAEPRVRPMAELAARVLERCASGHDRQ